jgi:hypothetical protein
MVLCSNAKVMFGREGGREGRNVLMFCVCTSNMVMDFFNPRTFGNSLFGN